jgi:hypothetical protein
MASGPIDKGNTTSHEFPVASSNVRDSLGDLDMVGFIILEIILQKQG